MNSSSAHSLPRLGARGRLLLMALVCACFGGLAPSRGASGATRVAAAPQADLTVTKSGDETAPVGGTITYALTVTNGGPDDATNVVLTDPLPAHTTYVMANSGPNATVTFANNTLTVNFGTLAPFDSASASLVVTVNGDVPRNTVISNTATVTSNTPDPEESNNTATALTFITGPFAGDLLITELRLRGPGGANDEFIEIYNNSDTPHLVNTVDGSAGYAVAASDGAVRCTVPSGRVIPARGHFLCVNLAGYSLATYPAGEGTTAGGDDSYMLDIPDNAGVAIFRTANTQNFNLENRLDAVGSTAETNTLYKEGAGYPALSGTSYTNGLNYSFYRDVCGKGGSTTVLGTCPAGGLPRDTNDNAADFLFVDTTGASAGAGQRLGAPGPENLSSPTQRNSQFAGPNLDSTVSSASPPNRVRDFTSTNPLTSTFGTLEIRKRIVNATGAPVTRLRFRVVDMSTFPVPSGFADLRPITSTVTTVENVKDPATCPDGVTPCTVTVQGTTLEQPPVQPMGGGFNSTLSVDTVLLASPLMPGESVNVRFVLGVQQPGTFKFYVNVEALTGDPNGESPTPERPLNHVRTGKEVRKQLVARPFRDN